MRNTLATVQAILGATARSARNVDEFSGAFTARITSLAKTHLILTEDEQQVASLRDLLCVELAAFDSPGGPRVRLEGPDVKLPSDVAVPFAMAIHELTANAVRYGALSEPAGRIHIAWDMLMADEARHLHLEWIEHNGPPVHVPTHQGFGTRLLKRMLTIQADAVVTADYRPEGLRFTIDMPLKLVSERS